MTNGQNPAYPSPQPPWVGQPTNPGVPVQPQPAQQVVQQPGYPVPPAPAPQPVQPGMMPNPAAMAGVAPSAFVQPGAVMPAQPQPQPGGVPQYHMPNDADVLAAYHHHRQEAANWGSGGDRIPFVKWPGPQGQTKWDKTVPIGYEASVYAYILPPWGPGKNIFRIVRSHFWKSYNSPNGTSVGCPGSAQCLICQAKEAALNTADPNLQKRAKEFGRVRTQYLYNVVLLDNPNGHFGQDGQMRPFVLGSGAFLHKAIGDIVEDKKGALNVVDPMRGRPIRMKRNKNGPNDMDIQYAAIAQDPSPMPSHFYPCLQNIWDLDKLDKQPTMDDMVKAVQDMGLPLPAGMPTVQPQAFPTQAFPTQGFQPAPAPAQPNPYPQPQIPVGDPQATTYMPPPADPYEFPPREPVVQTTQMYPAQVPTQPMPAPVPPPVQAQPQYPVNPTPAQMPTQPAPMQQPVYPVPTQQPIQQPIQTAPPAQMPVPPPVTSQPAPQQPVQVPQPTQAIPAPPPPGTVVPQQAPAAPQGQIPPAPPVTAPPQVAQQPVRQPVAAQQPTTRPPCFGKPNPQDRTCLECPDQLKAECYATAGQPVQAVVQPQGLTQLQNQLVGTPAQ